MTADPKSLWVYLAANPLLHLTLTLLAYQFGDWIYRKANLNPLLNPVMISIAVLVSILLATSTDYATYFEGAQFVHFLLGPATVALAIPLYKQFHIVRRSAVAIMAAVLAGSLTAVVSAVAIAWALGASAQTVASIAPKSVTAAIAMGISEKIGGLPSLTAVLVIVTGIIGASLGPLLLNLIGIKDWATRGLAIGVAAHGIGTARALQVNEVAGAFAGLAMGLNALATAILLPLLWHWFF